MEEMTEKYLKFKNNMNKLVEYFDDDLAEKSAEILTEISKEKYDKDFIKYFIGAWKTVEGSSIEAAKDSIDKAKDLTLEDLECWGAVDRIDIYRIMYQAKGGVIKE